MEGCANFRDTGGYEAGGGMVLPAVLYRSDSLHRLTDADRELLESLEITTAIDLRSRMEVEEAPAKLPASVELRTVPTLDNPMNAPLTRPEITSLAESYCALLHESITEHAAAVTAIADADGPTVVFCTAGKDRTGLVIALSLGLVGVDDTDLVADYALSGEVMDQVRASIALDRPERVAEWMARGSHVLRADPAAIEAALDRLRSRWGGFAGYASAGGVEPATIEALRTKLVHTF